MKLLTKAQFDKLLDNGRLQAPLKGTEGELDFAPVVKLFNAYGAGTWLLTELDPDEPDMAWALADLGVGCAEFGTVSLSELAALKHPLGFSLIERDRNWEASAPISAYIRASQEAGHIIDHLPAELRPAQTL
ncbi:MAG: hypothetical protein B7Y80_18390 [Hyphomicrobium sp. 32-62-53]|nr:MAG: hypothetical protein B7Z29_18175 [Hyphomicrobium sp. 12-62-95]OYX97835.1 MAG: hypothetical protein B7Y80_18390 [Hyphomicrobium sp. 32-62-53]